LQQAEKHHALHLATIREKSLTAPKTLLKAFTRSDIDKFVLQAQKSQQQPLLDSSTTANIKFTNLDENSPAVLSALQEDRSRQEKDDTVSGRASKFVVN
jgi:hypothetical protein